MYFIQVFEGPPPPPQSGNARNLKNALSLPIVVKNKIDNELEAGRLAGPFINKPIGLVTSPIGLVDKQVKGSYRLIHHLSHPIGVPLMMGYHTNVQMSNITLLMMRSCKLTI